MANKSKLQPVTPDDFNISDLRRAAREGRLFILPSASTSDDVSHNLLDEMLAYVAQIDTFVTPRYQTVIHQLWQAILTDEQMASKTVIRKGRDRGRFNRYFVTVLVCWMHEQGIYRHDIPAVRLHLVLEHVEEKNTYYKSMYAYLLTRREYKHLHSIVDNLVQNIGV